VSRDREAERVMAGVRLRQGGATLELFQFRYK
jgi:hypothetical protein